MTYLFTTNQNITGPKYDEFSKIRQIGSGIIMSPKVVMKEEPTKHNENTVSTLRKKV